MQVFKQIAASASFWVIFDLINDIRALQILYLEIKFIKSDLLHLICFVQILIFESDRKIDFGPPSLLNFVHTFT